MGHYIVLEVIMSLRIVVEEIDEHNIVANEATGDKRIGQVLNRHCVGIDSQEFIDVEVCHLLHCMGSGHPAKGPEFEHSVIVIRCGESCGR